MNFRNIKPVLLGFLFVLSLSPVFGERRVSAERQKLIDYGLTLQGTRYVYGGKQPETGLDCSGFVAYTAKEALGKNIYVSAATMYQTMEHISEDEKEPGDLIFFAVRSGTSYRVSHVGIYLGLYHGKGSLDGERIFLHSASDGRYTGVIVSSINDKYWKNYFYGYARFLPPTKFEEDTSIDSKETEEIVQTTGIIYEDMLSQPSGLVLAKQEPPADSSQDETSQIKITAIREESIVEEKKKAEDSPNNS